MRGWRDLSVVARALLRHAVVSLLALAGIGVVAGAICIHLVQDAALRQASRDGDGIARRVVAPFLTDGVYEGEIDSQVALDRRVRARLVDGTIQRIKVWSADGVIVYSDDPREIGLRYPLAPDDRAVLASGGTDADVSDLTKSENRLDRGFGESLEVYAGVRDTRGRPVLVETYFTATRLHADESALLFRIVPVILGAVVLVGLMLVPLAFGLARRIARHERERHAMVRLAAEASTVERRRVAGELHDGVIQDLAGVGYALTALDGQLAGLEGTSAPDAGGCRTGTGDVRGVLQRVQHLVHEDVLALRELTSVPYADAAVGATDPVRALHVAAEEIRRSGTPVEADLGALPALSGPHREALVRAGREALRNAATHAPGAPVRMTLAPHRRGVVLSVTDSGPGYRIGSAPGPLEGCMGLALLSDTVETIGGRLTVMSAPGRGTTVRLLLPLPQ
ncbi:MAG TPA: ATP-binding protein [Mycobacteriales bacterium]|jgi:two-component system NarL family sensor kinase|nr:ATP-binding protein [Mycobacteriales bacterium]